MPDFICFIDEQGATCFHWAAKRGDYDILDLLKTRYGSVLDVPAKCDNQMKPQHWAASDGKVEALKFFLDNRMDMNCTDANGCSPLSVAVQYMHTDTALYLIKQGADLTLKDDNGDGALHWAAYKGSEDLVGLLTHFIPGDVDKTDNFGQTPVHLAALAGHHYVVEYLMLENRVDMSKKDKNGLTPLDLAMKKSQVKCEWAIRRHLSNGKLDLLLKMGWRRLKIRNMLPYFICGMGDKETGRWMWRATFFPNLVASLISIYYASMSNMRDTALLQLLSSIVQLLWWSCFLILLYVTPAYVKDAGKDANDFHDSYDKALDRIAYVLGVENPLTRMSMSRPTVCHSCHLVRPLRSKHCRVSRRCVHKFDHYCPFVGGKF